MNNCINHIKLLYTSKEINNFISNIKPVDLQDDLRQELALALLSIGCEKINSISENKGLIPFSIKILSNMAFSSTSPFYKKFKKNYYKEAIDYLKSQIKLPTLDSNLHGIINNRLKDKYTKDEINAHEAILFNSYVEFRSCQKVATHYGIPLKHVKDVVYKTKKELKQLCTSQF